MINRIPPYFIHNDIRGGIQGLLNFGTWEEVNYITSTANSIRGGHYHKKTSEAFFIIEGEINVITKNIADNDTNISEDLVKQGDCFIIEPMTLHTFNIINDAKWLNFLSCKTKETDKDIFNK
jgi:mannose-6-phosphate isomerase-like protein (cupin superfamily)